MKEREEPVHVPVLLNEVLALLAPAPGDSCLDLTLGAGGHAKAILDRLGDEGWLTGVDQDADMLEIAKERLADDRVEFVHGNFGELSRLRDLLSRRSYDVLLADLGVSSAHLDRADRGFSFRRDGDLDMRLDRRASRSAKELVNEASAEELTRICREYGEERRARQVAEAIVRARQARPFETTAELADVVRKAVGKGRSGGIDAATRTFQGLRIAVNRELDVLDRFLLHFDPLVAPGGRLAVISYHSLEDRRVKDAFRERTRGGDYESLTPRPVRPENDEVARNPRARSARLRVLRKRRRPSAT